MLSNKSHSRLFLFTTVTLLSGLSPCLSSESVTHYNFSSINPASLGSPFCAGGYNANALTGVDKNTMGQPFRQANTNTSNTSGGYVGFNFSTIDKGGAAFSHAFPPEHTNTTAQTQADLTGQTAVTEHSPVQTSPAQTVPAQPTFTEQTQQMMPSPYVGIPQSFTPAHAFTPQIHKSFQSGEPQDLQPAPTGDADTTFNGTTH